MTTITGTPAPEQAATEARANRFYITKCDAYDQVTFTAGPGVLRQIPFAVSADRTVKTGLQMTGRSPFQTVFVVDETTGKALFAITQNAGFEAESKKKKQPKQDPPPPPDPECCQSAGCVPPLACIVDDHTCWCIDFGSSTPERRPQVPAHKVAPFKAGDPLRSMLAILAR